MDLMVQNIDLALKIYQKMYQGNISRKNISNKLMILRSDRKKWQKKVMSEKNQRVMTQGRREVEVGTLLLGNDKNNVIADIFF